MSADRGARRTMSDGAGSMPKSAGSSSWARQSRTVEERGEYFINMFDPEGNEFDVQ
jgi:hypothetical protein